LNTQWQSHWNWKPSRKNLLRLFGRKGFAIALSLLIILIGGVVMYSDPNNPLFHNYTQSSTSDPTTPIWDDNFVNNDLGGWRTSPLAIYSSTSSGTCTNAGNGVTSCKGILLSANSTSSAYAITRTAITVSAAVNKVLVANLWYMRTTATAITNGMEWEMYLTTNSTLPTAQTYNPISDLSVGLVLRIHAFSATQANIKLLLQRIYSQPITNIDFANCAINSACFQLLAAQTIPVQNNQLEVAELMNETGAQGRSTLEQNDINLGTAGSIDTTNLPWFDMNQQYYVGVWSSNGTVPLLMLSNIGTSGDCSGLVPTIFDCISLIEYQPTVAAFTTTIGPPPQIDLGGFFGPLIRAIISIGIFILNGIFGFIGFILPAIQQALGVLENVLTQVLNFLGNLLWPGSNLGTLLAGFLNAIIQLFTNTSYGLPAFFANFPSYFTNFLSWLQITFPFLAPMFSIANAILGFAVSVVPTGVTIMTLGLQMFLFGYGTLILASFFIYTGDDGIGGFLTFLGTLEALSFKILNIIATLTNLGLDILVIIVSLIPKPLIQMSASKLPRLPTLETGATMAFPVMDLGEARNGNMVVYWLWSMGLYMLAWFESRNPSLPGSLGAMYAPLATNMRILSVYLPLLQAMVLISGGLLLAWTAMMPLRTIGFDIMGLSPFGVSLGRRTGTGPSTVKLAVGQKHVVGPAAKAEKERRRQKEFEAKKEEEARKGIVKHAKTQEEKRRSEELRKKEIERKPTGKDIKGPDLT